MKKTCENAFCSFLPEDERQLMCSQAKTVCYSAKQTCHLKIGGEGQLLIISSGCLFIVRTRLDGRQLGTEVLSKGEVIGLTNLLRNTRDLTFYTNTDIKGCLIPHDFFYEFCLNRPEIARIIILHISLRHARLINKMEHLTLDNSREKILYLIQKINYESSISDSRIFAFTHEELALLAGANRVTVSRAVKQLKQQGIITSVAKGKFRLTESYYNTDYFARQR
ncbi:MAG: Crp/Fnr family transcriptional regulator [Gracilibacteraceae bacterium]|jgi:CRP-like cAMP-binding protein|nr:Crp/Fnr family transcriptional regulator [Gracilibacteraceae bacterium]